jgi:hypothetical protein
MVFGHKTPRKGLWNRLTAQAGVEPLVAFAIAYACYPSPSQPHRLQARVLREDAWKITEAFLDHRTIDLHGCCESLFGLSADGVEEAMLEDDDLASRNGTISALLRR